MEWIPAADQEALASLHELGIQQIARTQDVTTDEARVFLDEADGYMLRAVQPTWKRSPELGMGKGMQELGRNYPAVVDNHNYTALPALWAEINYCGWSPQHRLWVGQQLARVISGEISSAGDQLAIAISFRAENIGRLQQADQFMKRARAAASE